MATNYKNDVRSYYVKNNGEHYITFSKPEQLPDGSYRLKYYLKTAFISPSWEKEFETKKKPVEIKLISQKDLQQTKMFARRYTHFVEDALILQNEKLENLEKLKTDKNIFSKFAKLWKILKK